MHPLITTAYAAFNSRDIDTALTTMRPDVRWPKAFEGDFVTGHDAIREYWTRQWGEINPHVTPVAITELPNGRLEVTVHQIVKSLDGTELFNGNVKHIYTLRDGLIQAMELE
ncbi:ketosteroid isomerase [Flavobacterium akiainvivens]|uniref:Ketosteroid isomerase n=1 Tax=Flavobacterium akiainvivens TaxID=1202724 RepID=A0A0M9VH66_9FLAO|nr:nuclear transport factor 2 family protein [Flavobacterium akiainvivens]KOS05226.1 ketosteroid isomerase [Flavobacterium akiainvivens]SFQ50446.1 SnoaL-like domain-containing protein [Flavobacterium akiainvivens]